MKLLYSTNKYLWMGVASIQMTIISLLMSSGLIKVCSLNESSLEAINKLMNCKVN
jgi:hypothetical protein